MTDSGYALFKIAIFFSKMMSTVVSILLFVAFWCYQILSLQIIPERAGVVYYNKKYVEGGKFFVRRYSRRGNYYLNLEGTSKHVWDNNVSVHLIFYEYLHNEYKLSFVDMQFKMCDLVNKDPYVGKALANAGMPCPMPKGYIKIHNISIPSNDFPNVWPFERCKVDIRYQLTSSGELMANIEAYLYFKDRERVNKYHKNITKQ